MASRPTLHSPTLFEKAIGVLCLAVPEKLWRTAAASAGFHDVLCEHPEVPRPVADGFFWAAMHIEGTPAVFRDVLFRAVTFSKSKATRNAPTIFSDQPDLFKP